MYGKAEMCLPCPWHGVGAEDSTEVISMFGVTLARLQVIGRTLAFALSEVRSHWKFFAREETHANLHFSGVTLITGLRTGVKIKARN